VHACYGKSHILQGVDFHLGEGEIVSLLGRDGVGRCTTIKAIMGEVARTGSVVFKGRETMGLKPHQIARCGLGYVTENRDIFPQITVREKLILGMKSTQESGRWRMQDMFDLFPRLQERAETPGGVLILLVEQKLAIALRISKRLYVMGHGRIVFEGTAAGLKANEAVRKEWLEV
jgi:branched-chain amino acid transport system ATP-binding protein